MKLRISVLFIFLLTAKVVVASESGQSRTRKRLSYDTGQPHTNAMLTRPANNTDSTGIRALINNHVVPMPAVIVAAITPGSQLADQRHRHRNTKSTQVCKTLS